jgi:hypothetical protein
MEKELLVVQEVINYKPGDYEVYSTKADRYARERFHELKKLWPGRKFLLVKRTTTDELVAD